MNQQILVPDIGDYASVEIIDISATIGGSLNKEDTIITLETDKATMDIPAPYNLTIVELHVKKGDKVSKGSLIATVIAAEVINDNKINNTEKTINTSINTPINTTNTVSQTINHASPSTRKFARELGVSLDNISGTGTHGRIIESDVKSHVNNILNNNLSISNNTKNIINIDFNKWGETTAQSLSRIKKKSGQNLHRNWVSIPHVTHFDEADITELEKFRHTQQEIAKKQGIKLTMLTFFIKAIVNALKNFPVFNSSLSADGENLIIKKYYNIGIAVDTNQGLVVPVVKNADQKNLLLLAEELTNISQKARDLKLTSDDIQGGCFTISSLGGIGGVGFTPIINAPEVAILGVSRTQIKPIYINNQLQQRSILPLALSYDHRVIDGAEAARFSKFIVEQLTTPAFIKDKDHEHSNSH
jgi:pyruvate dehydrogenase E2 component (dihydrolipoamide acetyltransferase)